MRENLLHNFCAKKHLDEQAKKRYTIGVPGTHSSEGAERAGCDSYSIF